MGLSGRAKRGIAIFNAINQKSSKRWKYSAKMMTIEPPKLAANIVEAARAAMNALPEEMRNAYVPELSIKQDDAKPQEPEGGAEHGLPAQQEAGQETEKGTPGGPSCGI